MYSSSDDEYHHPVLLQERNILSSATFEQSEWSVHNGSRFYVTDCMYLFVELRQICVYDHDLFMLLVMSLMFVCLIGSKMFGL